MLQEKILQESHEARGAGQGTGPRKAGQAVVGGGGDGPWVAGSGCGMVRARGGRRSSSAHRGGSIAVGGQ